MNEFAASFPAVSTSDHWTDRVIKQGHVDYCAENGHATHTIDGIEQERCPRCGVVKRVEGYIGTVRGSGRIEYFTDATTAVAWSDDAQPCIVPNGADVINSRPDAPTCGSMTAAGPCAFTPEHSGECHHIAG